MQVIYENAREILLDLFSRTETGVGENVDRLLYDYAEQLDVVFGSRTQSYREVLLGCALVHLMCPAINIRLPYIKHGEGSFNGRTLDETVINPFFQEQLIPCSKGPYLATFRRNVKLTPETAEGLRDKIGYSAMLKLLEAIECCSTEAESENIVMCLLKRFIALRDASRIPLARLSRLSVCEYSGFLKTLLQKQSGGLIPVLLTVAFFQTLNEHYKLEWEISWQGINVADNATGVEGDVIVRRHGMATLAIEVTERPIDKRRVRSTFNTKIIHSDVREYLFIYTNAKPDDTALEASKNLFSQGYDINFVNIVDFIINNFYAMPSAARDVWADKMLVLLDSVEVSASIKIMWNGCVKSFLRI
jgi:hypothetical protein